MKAIQYNAFGNSAVIELVEVEKPQIIQADELLIKVKTASINPLDMKLRSGFMQKMMPIQLPYIPGLDVAGIVEAVGANVTRLKVGDEVMASTMGGGAYAEYALAKEANVSLKPSNISFEEATALVVPIGTAQSILFAEGHLQKGQKVLIQGASGAVGTAMIQMAKQAGAYVVATATGKGIELAKSLGADEVIDYKTQAVADFVKDVDLVADCAGGESQAKLFAVLKKGGKLLSIAGMPAIELAQAHEVEARFISSNLTYKNLLQGLELLKEGKLKPIVAKTFPLEAAAEAQDFLSAGSVLGKVVLAVQ